MGWTDRSCRVEGCNRMPSASTGVCKTHATQIRQGGTPGGKQGRGPTIPHEVVVEADRRNRRNFESITSLAREYGLSVPGLNRAIRRLRNSS